MTQKVKLINGLGVREDMKSIFDIFWYTTRVGAMLAATRSTLATRRDGCLEM